MRESFSWRVDYHAISILPVGVRGLGHWNRGIAVVEIRSLSLRFFEVMNFRHNWILS